MDAYRDLVPITVVDLRVFCSVADRPENSRLASIRSPDNKDPETAEFLLQVFEFTEVQILGITEIFGITEAFEITCVPRV